TKPFYNATVFEKLTKYLGVQFVYEELETARTLQGEKIVLTPERLASLPSDWVEQLGQAAVMGDDQAVHRIVDQIIGKDESLGQELRRMVKKFQFEKIMQLIQG